jgi:hypothetical protein
MRQLFQSLAPEGSGAVKLSPARLKKPIAWLKAFFAKKKKGE